MLLGQDLPLGGRALALSWRVFLDWGTAAPLTERWLGEVVQPRESGDGRGPEVVDAWRALTLFRLGCDRLEAGRSLAFFSLSEPESACVSLVPQAQVHPRSLLLTHAASGEGPLLSPGVAREPTNITLSGFPEAQ